MRKIMDFIGKLLVGLCMFPIKVFGYDADYTPFPLYGVMSPAESIVRKNVLFVPFLLVIGLGTFLMNK